MKITPHLDYEVILANRSCPVHFAVQFEAPSVEQARPRQAAFCIVLDRSGSMAGPPLQKAKQATLLAVRHLRLEDTFSLVVFADQAQVVIPFQSAKNRDQFLPVIERIAEGGSTNLTGGWMLRRHQLMNAPSGASRRLLLLSDETIEHGHRGTAIGRKDRGGRA
jgi:Ca-activated chloride channel family protein